MARSPQTLGQAREAGLKLVAVCDNVACRHQQLIDLDAVIDFVGAKHGLLPRKGEVHFSEKLRCSVCKGRGAFVWLIDLPAPEPMFEGPSYWINRWHHAEGHRLIETMAKASSEVIANVAFDAAVPHYRDSHLTLQQRHRVIRDARFRLIAGGRG